MSERTVIDVSQVVEQQKLGGFLVGLVVISWIITFFDGFDSQAIAFAAPYLSTQYHLDRIMMGNIFSMGLVGALIGGFGFGYLGDRIGRRPPSSWRLPRLDCSRWPSSSRIATPRCSLCVSSTESHWAGCCRSPGR
jgi:MFS family permease